jgi:hypothetical protein
VQTPDGSWYDGTMLNFDTTNGKLVSCKETNLIDESILERYGFQAAIIASWDEFCNELGMGQLYYVGSEVIPHDSCRDSIDILALDWDGTPIVIELKRAKHKLQLLQSLSYAAMLSTWTADDYLRLTADKPYHEDVKCLLEGYDELPSPKVVMIAEDYDPEVILTANFLRNHDIDLTAVGVKLVKHNNDILMSFDRRYPLPGLEDTYTPRGQSKKRVSEGEEIETTWNDVIEVSKLPWVSTAISELKKIGFASENPVKRYFGAKRGTPLGNIVAVSFRLDNMMVHVSGQTPENEENLKQLMQLPLESWGRTGDRRSGWAFRVRTEDDMKRFFKAMNKS